MQIVLRGIATRCYYKEQKEGKRINNSQCARITAEGAGGHKIETRKNISQNQTGINEK